MMMMMSRLVTFARCYSYSHERVPHGRSFNSEDCSCGWNNEIVIGQNENMRFLDWSYIFSVGFVADRTAHGSCTMIGCCHDTVVCLSV